MTCKNCGAEIGPDDKFCAVCGVSTAEKKIPNFCMHCGGRLSEGDRFCAVCGCAVGETRPSDNRDNRGISAGRLCYRQEQKGLDVRTIAMVTLLLICAGLFLVGTLLNWWRL